MAPTTVALVDWVEWTEFGLSADEVCAFLGGDFVEADRGAMGYRSGRVGPGGALVLYDGQEGMGVHVRATGRTCRALEESGFVDDWGGFLAYLLEEGRQITRFDVALDERAGKFTVASCYEALKAGELVDRFRRRMVNEYNDGEGQCVSRTLYFGSEKSDLRIRIYDKAQQLEVAGPWTRVEVQARDERAQALAAILCLSNGGQRTAGFASVLLHYLDFKSRGMGEQRCRWATAPWWSEFLRVVTKQGLALAAKALPSAEEALAAITRQYGPLLAAVVEELGYGVTFAAVEQQRERWRARHLRLSARWRAERRAA